MPQTPRFSGELEQVLRRRAEELPARRRAGRARLAAAALLGTAAMAFVVVPGGGGDGSEARAATGFHLSGGATIDVPAQLRPEDYRALRDAFDAVRARLVIRARPVEPTAHGRVFSVQAPPDARFDGAGRLVVDAGLDGPVVVDVGRASERAPRGAGLTIYEAIPQLCALVDAADARTTAGRLREAGYDLRIVPLGGAVLQDGLPEAGTIVVSLLDERGRYTSVDPSTRRLTLEVSLGAFEGHSGEPDAECT